MSLTEKERARRVTGWLAIFGLIMTQVGTYMIWGLEWTVFTTGIGLVILSIVAATQLD